MLEEKHKHFMRVLGRVFVLHRGYNIMRCEDPKCMQMYLVPIGYFCKKDTRSISEWLDAFMSKIMS